MPYPVDPPQCPLHLADLSLPIWSCLFNQGFTNVIFPRLCHPSLKWHLRDKNHRTIKAVFRTNWTVIRGEGEEKDPSFGCEPLHCKPAGSRWPQGFRFCTIALPSMLLWRRKYLSTQVSPKERMQRSSYIVSIAIWHFGGMASIFTLLNGWSKYSKNLDADKISHKSHKWHLCKMFLGWGKIFKN